MATARVASQQRLPSPLVLILCLLDCLLIAASFVAQPTLVAGWRRCSIRHQSGLFSSSTGSSSYMEDVRDAISDAGFDNEWNDSVTLLSESVGMGMDKAEACLAKIWQWQSWVSCKSEIAKKYIKTVPPDSQTLQQSLDWLKNGPLALSSEQLQAFIVGSPEAYLLDPETTYKEALNAAPPEFSNPDKFRALLLEDPSVLSCTYNCIDDGCASECGNCWVSYKNRGV